MGLTEQPHGRPSDKFGFVRSYIQRVLWPDRFIMESQTGGHFTFGEGGHPELHYTFTIKDKFWGWSSNNFTLDYIIEDAYVVIDPSPTKLTAATWVTYKSPTPTAGAAVAVDFVIISTLYNPVDLPSPAVPYWLP